MAVKLRLPDIARILQTVPKLARDPVKKMHLDYDEGADVLYVSFRRPQRASDSHMRDDGIIVHLREKEVVGLTILDASVRGRRVKHSRKRSA